MIKRMIATAAITAALVLPAAAAPDIGKEAPNFTARTADGKTVDLKSLRGKIVVLEWTNHQCPYVRMHYGANYMQTTQKDATAQGVVWLQIISSPRGKQGYLEGAEAIKVNAERNSVPTNVVLDPDGKVGSLYGAQTTPHMYVIDAKGTLVYKGGIDSIPSYRADTLPKAVNYVRETLAAMAANKPVPNPSTRAYGCTIHYGS
jgi:alkyl hydroperoxide reductase subunit AhpC